MENIHYGLAWVALIGAVAYFVTIGEDAWAIFFVFLLMIANPPKNKKECDCEQQ